MNHREVAKRVLRIATGAEPTEDQVDRLVDARKDGLRMRFLTVDWARSKTERPFKIGDIVECVDVESAPELVLLRKYTVSSVYDDGGAWVYLNGQDNITWRASRFRLVSRTNTVER